MKRISGMMIGVLVATAQGAWAAFPADQLRHELEASERVFSIGHGSHDEIVAETHASGYIQGIAEALAAYSIICYPPSVNTEQADAVVLKYLKANPEKWSLPAIPSVTEALKNAFPCSGQ